jgi:hypothetical protein
VSAKRSFSPPPLRTPLQPDFKGSVISPQDIRNRARKLWASGQPLRAAVVDARSESQPFFPIRVPFGKPTAQEWLDHFAELRAAVAALDAESKASLGAGYTVTFREVAHQKLGRLRIPERITFGSIEDLAACAGESDTLRRFLKFTETLQTREPRMTSWLAERPLVALASERQLPQLLDIAAHFQSNPRPNRFARELGISGVDSKFIEDNRTVLAEWLDRLLPGGAIDTGIRGLADHGFERRYGLRFEDPQIRFRWLDPSRAPAGISDATIPLPQLAAYAPACGHVIVTENKINFLTLPKSSNVLAIFGGGYAIDLLRALPWIANQPLHYWGDLDTHGFAILSRLRQFFPHTCSFLMDRDTLMMHRDLWTEELSGTRVLRDLPTLDPHEQALYDDLRNDRLGDRVRLEQERVKYQLVEQVVLALHR